jgi:hypothetical protein
MEQQFGVNVQVPPKKRQRSPWLGCLAVVLLFVGAFAVCGGGGLFITSVLVEHTAPLPGDASHFDPVASLSAVQNHAGSDTQLVKIDALYVRSDGTMDLNASYRADAEYTFVRQVAPPADAPPVGAGGTSGGQWYQEVSVEVYKPGQMRHVVSGNSTYDFINLGMDREDYTASSTLPGDIVPAPKCAFQKLWSLAAEKDAPTDAVAIIRYDSDGYTFDISDAHIHLTFSTDCKLQSS